MRQQLRAFLLGTMGVMVACGGGKTTTKTTTADEVSEEDDYEDDGEMLIPEEKFEEIKRTFERKAGLVARCFPEAVAAGEVDKNDRIKLTVGVVIQPNGSASDIEILGTSKRSETIETCMVRTISRWEFTTLPKSLQYSYGFVLQRF